MYTAVSRTGLHVLNYPGGLDLVKSSALGVLDSYPGGLDLVKSSALDPGGLDLVKSSALDSY